MIARLSGTLAETTADGAVIDVGGVGYQLLASARTLDALGPIGGEVTGPDRASGARGCLDPVRLRLGRRARRLPRADQRPGRRRAVALAILSALAPDELARAVAQDDKAMIGRANGVGPKLAARIANELQGKLGAPALAAARRRRAPEPPPTPCRPSPTSASSPPKPAPRSTPRRTSSAPSRRSTRWCGWL